MNVQASCSSTQNLLAAARFPCPEGYTEVNWNCYRLMEKESPTKFVNLNCKVQGAVVYDFMPRDAKTVVENVYEDTAGVRAECFSHS